MVRTSQLISFSFALLAILGAASYAGYRARTQGAALLGHITALDACLVARNQQRAQMAATTLRSINTIVNNNYYMDKYVAVLRQARQIQARTQGLADTLGQLRQQWSLAGSDARLAQLAAKLREYSGFIRQYYPAAPLSWQPDGQVPANGLLEPLDIAAEPRLAALATLTRLETQLRHDAAQALARQLQIVSGGCFAADHIGAFAAATSETVAPGTFYEAKLLVTGTAGYHHRLRMTADGHPAPFAPRTNHGLVRFAVPAARPGQPDTVRAQWQGRIRWNENDGDTTMQVTVPYFIVKHSTP